MSFPSPAGKPLTELPLGRNNSVMTSLFPPMESLVVTSRLGTGWETLEPFFLRCIMVGLPNLVQEILYICGPILGIYKSLTDT